MNIGRRTERTHLSTRMRAALIAAGLAALGVVATARSLDPDQRGFGTHEQLGLAPCWFFAHFGMVCPSCGMTTAWAHAMRGQWASAAASSAGGLALWAVTLAAAPWMLISGATGRWLWAAPRARLVLWLGTAVAAVTLMDWLRRALPL